LGLARFARERGLIVPGVNQSFGGFRNRNSGVSPVDAPPPLLLWILRAFLAVLAVFDAWIVGKVVFLLAAGGAESLAEWFRHLAGVTDTESTGAWLPQIALVLVLLVSLNYVTWRAQHHAGGRTGKTSA
jgi:hypothetical protein